MSSPRTTAQQRPKASKANYESSQGNDQGDGQADPFRPWHHANKPRLKDASRRTAANLRSGRTQAFATWADVTGVAMAA